MSTKDATVVLRLPKPVKDVVVQLALANKMTVSQTVRAILEGYLIAMTKKPS